MAATIVRKRSRQRVGRRDQLTHAAVIGHASTHLYRSLQARPDAACELRASLSDLLAKNAVDDGARSAALLCVQEALTNAIRHTGERESRIGVSVQVSRGDLKMEVRDRGCGFDAADLDLTAVPDPMDEHGRGLFLMQQLMDDVRITSDEHGTTVRMTLHLC